MRSFRNLQSMQNRHSVLLGCGSGANMTWEQCAALECSITISFCSFVIFLSILVFFAEVWVFRSFSYLSPRKLDHQKRFYWSCAHVGAFKRSTDAPVSKWKPIDGCTIMTLDEHLHRGNFMTFLTVAIFLFKLIAWNDYYRYRGSLGLARPWINE